jgi:hypothetical protein
MTVPALALERTPSLRTLTLVCNYIWAEGARHLAAALERGAMLVVLNLGESSVRDDGACHLAAALKQDTALTILDLSDNDNMVTCADPFRTTFETNYTLAELYGVDGVGDILECNRWVRVARKQKVMQFLFVARAHGWWSWLVPSRCCGSAWAEAVQPRAVFAGPECSAFAAVF